MAINVTIDGTLYEDVEVITVGGKTLLLAYSADSGSGDNSSGDSGGDTGGDAGGDAELNTDGLLAYIDLRNMTAEEVAGVTVGAGAGGQLPTLGDGAYFGWVNQLVNSSNEIGAKIGRNLWYTNNAQKSEVYAPEGDFTCATMVYNGFEVSGLAETFSSPLGIGLRIRYKNTSNGVSETFGEIIPGDKDAAVYRKICVVVRGSIACVYVDGAKVAEIDGNTLADFATWAVNVNNNAPISHGVGKNANSDPYLVAGVSYSRALSEVEVIELFEYFKTLEVV